MCGPKVAGELEEEFAVSFGLFAQEIEFGLLITIVLGWILV
jgi:hypothetical protein